LAIGATGLRSSCADYTIRAGCEHRDHEMAVGELGFVAHGLALLEHQLALLRRFGGAFRHDFAQPPADDALGRQGEQSGGSAIRSLVDPVDDCAR
jgi:hypothetical protein